MSDTRTLIAQAEQLAADRDQGASELLGELLPLLAAAIAAGRETTIAVVRTVCAGQPAMAPVWNAGAAALADAVRPGRFARVRAEMERSPRALVRAARATLRDALFDGPLDAPPARLVTLSYSGSVAETLASLASERPLDVVCGEGRPRYEGGRLAARLAAAGVRADLTPDAALASHLHGAAAVIVGADGVAATRWINKVGTFGLAAAAHWLGVPVYVVAGREKALAAPLAAGWTGVNGPPREVWEQPAAGVAVSNPYFEAIPVELATLFLTDAGPVPPEHTAAWAERFADDVQTLMSWV